MALTAASTAGTAWLMDPVVNKVFIARDASLLWPIGATSWGFRGQKNFGFHPGGGDQQAGQGRREHPNRLFSHLIGQHGDVPKPPQLFDFAFHL